MVRFLDNPEFYVYQGCLRVFHAAFTSNERTLRRKLLKSNMQMIFFACLSHEVKMECISRSPVNDVTSDSGRKPIGSSCRAECCLA